MRRKVGSPARRNLAAVGTSKESPWGDLPEGRSIRLRVYIGERDHHGHQPLYAAIVEAARRAGLAGATVYKGVAGFGAHSVVHAARVLDMSSDLPIVVEMIDETDKIRAFMPALTAMIDDGLVTADPVYVLYRGAGKSKR
jgi:PII-like signaling protein